RLGPTIRRRRRGPTVRDPRGAARCRASHAGDSYPATIVERVFEYKRNRQWLFSAPSQPAQAWISHPSGRRWGRRGPSCVSEVRAGEARVGAGPASEVRGAEVRAGEVRLIAPRVSEVRVGDARVGELRADEARLGEVRVEEVRVGEIRAGEVRLGEVR